MNEQVLHTLEFDEIRKMLASRAVSGLAKKMAMEWVPSSEQSVIQEWLTETEEATICLQKEIATRSGASGDGESDHRLFGGKRYSGNTTGIYGSFRYALHTQPYASLL